MKQRDRILIVDDDEPVRRLLVELLSHSYHCIVANSAEDALDTLNAQQFDLVITDINMPGMSGIDLCRLIRDTFPETAVILMSGGHSKVTKPEQGCGAGGYLAKPFINTELLGIDRNRRGIGALIR